MLETIKNTLLSIGDFFVTIFDFVVGFVNDIINVIKYCASAVAKIPDYFAWLPAEILAIIVALFAIVVIYKVLGREG